MQSNEKEGSVLTLDRLSPGQSGRVVTVGGEGTLRLRLLDMGIIPGTMIRMHKIAPLGDPMEVQLRGYMLSLRKDDAKNIELEAEDK